MPHVKGWKVKVQMLFICNVHLLADLCKALIFSRLNYHSLTFTQKDTIGQGISRGSNHRLYHHCYSWPTATTHPSVAGTLVQSLDHLRAYIIPATVSSRLIHLKSFITWFKLSEESPKIYRMSRSKEANSHLQESALLRLEGTRLCCQRQLQL